MGTTAPWQDLLRADSSGAISLRGECRTILGVAAGLACLFVVPQVGQADCCSLSIALPWFITDASLVEGAFRGSDPWR